MDATKFGWKTVAVRICRIAVFAYMGLLALLAGCQRRYIYYPERVEEAELVRLATQAGLERWTDREGESIGWKRVAPEGSGALRRALVFHGNAGMAVRRFYYPDGLQEASGEERWEVYVLEYPGYGARQGAPGEEVFFAAAREGVRELLGERIDPLYLVGESLGSGVASRMAAEFGERVGGVLLVTPYTSLADVGARHFRAFPVRWVLRDRFDNVEALENYEGPLAVLLAENDEVVPTDLGQRLFDGYDGPKRLWVQEGANHNTLDLTPEAVWWGEVIRWWESERRL